MAEFTEVVRQKLRMCETFDECDECPLTGNECDIIRRMLLGNEEVIKTAQRLEQTVMTWAAEHPEPVYPTWLSVIVEHFKAGITDREVLAWLAENHIPADIAQKLGIKPKEVEKDV